MNLVQIGSNEFFPQLIRLAVYAATFRGNHLSVNLMTVLQVITEFSGDGIVRDGQSLDLLDVDFLSVPAMIGVGRDTALSITDKCHASEITLDEECLGTQRQILILVLTEM